jgi:hypothetical protein
MEMSQSETKELSPSDIGYRGKPIETLTKEELMDAFLELSQLIYNCASTNNQCKAMISINHN